MNVCNTVQIAVVVSRMLIAHDDFRNATHVTAHDAEVCTMMATRFAPSPVMATSPKWSAL